MADKLQVLKDDPWLEPYAGHINWRYQRAMEKIKEIEKNEEGGMDGFTQGYKKLGFNRKGNGIEYREWAPGATAMFLFGDFNGWNQHSHPLQRNEFGVFSIFLPDRPDGSSAIPHDSKIKVLVQTHDGKLHDRIPAWISRVYQFPNHICYDGIYWNPPHKYEWKHKAPPKPASLTIYETHVGMASQEPRVGSYNEFTDTVLPYVRDLGYNAVQLMAVMEHAYYASFGYQVTNFFAISSRFGTPEDLKRLIDRAHELGIMVIMDVVHSHASKNVNDGLNWFDGTDHQYFHDGGKGYHPMWDSRLFDYGKWEVLRFLLSNLRWYLEEYRFDGFRFDGVTSMLYLHHGVAHGFDDGYNEYVPPHTDEDAILYLTLANYFIHKYFPNSVTIAEDVSGFPGMCRPVEEGGVGFDYRLGMAIPDKWIKLLKEFKDDDWNMGNIVFTLTNRRFKEATVAYAESHDQALVGDKTLAFWLMDKEMYDFMSVLSPQSLIIDRGIALHKMIRLITFGLGGEGYLTFMGNEFGHPEWIDFPREGNNYSYHYARRRWDLAKDNLLKYKFLLAFEKAMIALNRTYHVLESCETYVSWKHEGDKVIVFERGGLLWAFNFHPTSSFTDYRLGVNVEGKYKIVLNSDNAAFGGHGRIDENTEFHTHGSDFANRKTSLMVYLPSRTAIVLAKIN